MIFSPKNLFLLFTRRAEKESRRGDLSPEGAGDAAQRLVIFLIFVDTFHFRFRSFFFVLIKIISMKKYSDIERIKA